MEDNLKDRIDAAIEDFSANYFKPEELYVRKYITIAYMKGVNVRINVEKWFLVNREVGPVGVDWRAIFCFTDEAEAQEAVALGIAPLW